MGDDRESRCPVGGRQRTDRRADPARLPWTWGRTAPRLRGLRGRARIPRHPAPGRTAGTERATGGHEVTVTEARVAPARPARANAANAMPVPRHPRPSPAPGHRASPAPATALTASPARPIHRGVAPRRSDGRPVSRPFLRSPGEISPGHPTRLPMTFVIACPPANVIDGRRHRHLAPPVPEPQRLWA
jgi:hypothetical protein